MPRPIRAAFSIPYGAAFGAVRAGGKRSHLGTDYHCPVGTPIYGTGEGGRVTHIGYNGDPQLGLGHNVTVTYPGGVVTLDAHMRSRTPLAVGSAVSSSTLLGYVGLTGNAVNADPPGAHDHHQRWHDNVLVNPESVYGSDGAGVAGGGIYGEEDDMYSEADRQRDNAIYAGMWNGGTNMVDGVPMRYNYGTLHMEVANQQLIARLISGQAALQAAVNALAGGTGADPAAVQAAARAGAAEALGSLELPTLDTSELVGAVVGAVRVAIAEQHVDVDLSAIEAYLQEQFAGVNANIDDQPTEFTITPK